MSPLGSIARARLSAAGVAPDESDDDENAACGSGGPRVLWNTQPCYAFMTIWMTCCVFFRINLDFQT